MTDGSAGRGRSGQSTREFPQHVAETGERARLAQTTTRRYRGAGALEEMPADDSATARAGSSTQKTLCDSAPPKANWSAWGCVVERHEAPAEQREPNQHALQFRSHARSWQAKLPRTVTDSADRPIRTMNIGPSRGRQ